MAVLRQIGPPSNRRPGLLDSPLVSSDAPDLAQLITRRELTAHEQRMARVSYAYGVDLRRAHWLDDSTVGEPVMRTVDRRWGSLIEDLAI